MSRWTLARGLAIWAALAYLALAELSDARQLAPEHHQAARPLPAQADYARLLAAVEPDEQDDDEVEEKATSGAPSALPSSASQVRAPAGDLKAAASHHHHGHHAKGWLDMGAWTGKKGAFGWYDKHPVGGKGK